MFRGLAQSPIEARHSSRCVSCHSRGRAQSYVCPSGSELVNCKSRPNLATACHSSSQSRLELTAISIAADFKNVSIVAHYIKDRTKDAQFIIIRCALQSMTSSLLQSARDSFCAQTRLSPFVISWEQFFSLFCESWLLEWPWCNFPPGCRTFGLISSLQLQKFCRCLSSSIRHSLAYYLEVFEGNMHVADLSLRYTLLVNLRL
jgi:hypothetical protein